jgi:heptose I phosphotransferase
VTRRTLVSPQWRDRLARAGLTDLTLLLGDGAPAHLRGRWEALTKPGLAGRERWRWELDGPDGGVLYLKRYVRVPPGVQLDRLRRQTALHSRAWWEFRQSAALAAQDVPTPCAVALAEEMRGPLERRSAVLLQSAPGDAFDRVWTLVAAQRAPIAHRAARHELTRQLARLIAAFHATGLCHRDLYLCHVFVDLDPQARRPARFTLIDLARTHRPRLRRRRWILKDLAQLDSSARLIGATRTDRLRFLLTYLGHGLGRARHAAYARRIVAKSTRHESRHHSGRRGCAPRRSGDVDGRDGPRAGRARAGRRGRLSRHMR